MDEEEGRKNEKSPKEVGSSSEIIDTKFRMVFADTRQRIKFKWKKTTSVMKTRYIRYHSIIE